MVNKYRVIGADETVENVDIRGNLHRPGDEVELEAEDAASLVEAGTLELIGEASAPVADAPAPEAPAAPEGVATAPAEVPTAPEAPAGEATAPAADAPAEVPAADAPAPTGDNPTGAAA